MPSFAGMIKDGGTNPSTSCKIAAQQLAADSDIVGVVGAMRSSCSKASHQYFRDNGKLVCLWRFSLWTCSVIGTRVKVRIKLNHCSISGFCAVSFHCAPIMALVFGRTNEEQIVSSQAT